MKLSKIAALLSASLLAALVASAVVSAREAEEPDAKSSKATAAQENAQDAAEETPAVSARPPARPARVLYRPPKLGKPARTVGGGSRGTPNKLPRLFVAAPDHVGRTTSLEPSLYWYIDQVPGEGIQIEFTILDEESIDPKVETTLTTPQSAGVQQIRLADYGARLDAATEYEWSVAIVLDPNERSKDIVATGWIDRVEPSPDLVARLEVGESLQDAAAYAEEGIWYDAFAALSAEIDRHPEDGQLQERRADLLRQVGLDEAEGGSVR